MKLRRSMMFVPGNNPGMLQNAGIYGADSVILAVEDAVAVTEKDAARHLVAAAIKTVKYSQEVAVRINHIRTPYGEKDLEVILPSKPDLIRLPVAETADDIITVDQIITEAEKKYGFEPGSIQMMGAIETAKGLFNAREIIAASPRMVALAIGGEDFVADLRTTRTAHGKELFVAKSHIVLAARAEGVMAIDTVYSDVSNEEGFRADLQLAKDLGFDGKSVINPRQIGIVHELFSPSEKELEYAKRVLAAFEEALVKKSGVIALDGKMIDKPIVDRARRMLAYGAAVSGQKEEA